MSALGPILVSTSAHSAVYFTPPPLPALDYKSPFFSSDLSACHISECLPNK